MGISAGRLRFKAATPVEVSLCHSHPGPAQASKNDRRGATSQREDNGPDALVFTPDGSPPARPMHLIRHDTTTAAGRGSGLPKRSRSTMEGKLDAAPGPPLDRHNPVPPQTHGGKVASVQGKAELDTGPQEDVAQSHGEPQAQHGLGVVEVIQDFKRHGLQSRREVTHGTHKLALQPLASLDNITSEEFHTQCASPRAQAAC